MSQHQHLHADRAIRKIKEIAGHAPVCLFQTRLGQRPIPTRPMHVAEVDAQGNLWFLAPADRIREQLLGDSDVQLLFSNAAEAEHMSIHGHARATQDADRIRQLRQHVPPAWLATDGAPASDDGLCAIMVEPQDGYYWDAAENTGKSMVRSMVAGVFGREGHVAVEGRLNAPPGQRPVDP